MDAQPENALLCHFRDGRVCRSHQVHCLSCLQCICMHTGVAASTGAFRDFTVTRLVVSNQHISMQLTNPCARNRQATFNLQWPKGSQKRLAPRFVTENEAKTAAAGSSVGGGSAPSPAAQPATTTGAGNGQVSILRPR